MSNHNIWQDYHKSTGLKFSGKVKCVKMKYFYSDNYAFIIPFFTGCHGIDGAHALHLHNKPVGHTIIIPKQQIKRLRTSEVEKQTKNPVCVNCMACELYLNKAVKKQNTMKQFCLMIKPTCHIS